MKWNPARLGEHLKSRSLSLCNAPSFIVKVPRCSLLHEITCIGNGNQWKLKLSHGPPWCRHAHISWNRNTIDRHNSVHSYYQHKLDERKQNQTSPWATGCRRALRDAAASFKIINVTAKRFSQRVGVGLHPSQNTARAQRKVSNGHGLGTCLLTIIST